MIKKMKKIDNKNITNYRKLDKNNKLFLELNKNAEENRFKIRINAIYSITAICIALIIGMFFGSELMTILPYLSMFFLILSFLLVVFYYFYQS